MSNIISLNPEREAQVQEQADSDVRVEVFDDLVIDDHIDNPVAKALTNIV